MSKKVEKEFIIENIFRTEMFLKSIPALKSSLIKELKSTKPQPFRKRILEDTITVLKAIQDRKDFNYKEAFVFAVCFSPSFEKLRVEIQSGRYDLNENFYREDYWREEDILYNDGLYFSYPFVFESYKKEMSIDMKHLAEKIDSSSKLGNINLIAKQYIDFLKKIEKKSD